MLTDDERKQRLPFGAQERVAEVVDCAKSFVNAVRQGTKRHRRIERELARRMRPATTVTEAFGPAARSMRRTQRKRRAKS